MAWKQVIYNGLVYTNYECNEEGQVRSLSYRRTGKPRLLKPNYASRGYAKVWLVCGRLKVRAIVSRIIAETFIPNPENKPYVDHIDTNKRNNKRDNLRWVTHQENCNNEQTCRNRRTAHRPENARFYGCFGAAHNRSLAVRCVETERVFGSIREAARESGLNHQTIVACLRGRSKTAGKRHWEYVKEAV